MRDHLAAVQARTKAVAAAAAHAKTETEAAQNLFARSVGPVIRLAPTPTALLTGWPPRPQPVPLQRRHDEVAVLHAPLSDAFDVAALLDTDASFRRSASATEVTLKLRRGDWPIQRQLDLHGLRTDTAREALAAFIRSAHRHGLRCLRVVHGKGLGSPGQTSVLKSRVQSWLVQKNEVLAFVQAKPADGGTGALLVLLAAQRTSPAAHD